MTSADDRKRDETVDGLTELEGEELIEVVRQTVDDLQLMLNRLQRFVDDEGDRGGERGGR